MSRMEIPFTVRHQPIHLTYLVCLVAQSPYEPHDLSISIPNEVCLYISQLRSSQGHVSIWIQTQRDLQIHQNVHDRDALVDV